MCYGTPYWKSRGGCIVKIFRGGKSVVGCIVELDNNGYTTQLVLEKSLLQVVTTRPTGFNGATPVDETYF